VQVTSFIFFSYELEPGERFKVYFQVYPYPANKPEDLDDNPGSMAKSAEASLLKVIMLFQLINIVE
jgi:hypothetical protein